MRGAPHQGLAGRQLPCQGSNRRTGFWAPAALPSRDPGPEKPEALAMPGDHRLRSDDDQGLASVPGPGEAQPEQPICPSQSGSGTAPLEDHQLLAKGQVLQGNFPNTAGQNEKANQ